MSSAELETSSLNEEKHEVTLDEALQLAHGHHQSGNYILAERTYRDILRAVPDHFPTTQFLGVLLFQAANFEEALHYLELAVKTEPENASCLNNYGGVLAQTGNNEKALEYYDRALKVAPEYLEALNNKSFALWSLERYKESEEVCRAALRIAPEDLVSLNGLALALAKRSKYDEALDAWEEAAKINPNEVMVWSNWGNALREMGRIKPALEKCEKAVDLDPKNPESLNNLANVLRDMGRADEALELYTKATNMRPEYYQAHCNAAIAYGDKNLYEESVVAARYAIAFKPEFAEAYGPLCNGLCELGEFDQAHVMAQRALHYSPDSAAPYLNLADVLSRVDQFDDAEAAIQEAVKREPDSARAFMTLSEIRERINDYEGALAAVEQGLEISPDMIALYVRRGLIHFYNENAEEGLKSIDHALARAPEYLAAMQHKAELLISLNRNDEALEIIEKVIGINKEIPGAYSTLVTLRKFKTEDDVDFQNMKKLEANIETFGQAASSVYFYAMCEAHEQLGNYDEAFKYLKMANDIKMKQVPHSRWRENNVHKTIATQYPPALLERLSGHGYDSDVPVFIVGMPRSGTTLTEQILASHPDVFGAGELNELGDVHRILPHELTPEDTLALGKEYVDLVKKKDKSGTAKRIVDKMPANYLYLGFIASILPNAKIIHCRRNPIDTCLSCYKQSFARGQYFSYDLDDLATEYQEYLDMMEYWRQQLPGRFIEVDYEETVNNFEAQARRLIDHVGLEWNDACLEPHKQKRTVITASKAQVTQPVYKTSVEKWKRYEKHLQPLVTRLLPDQALAE